MMFVALSHLCTEYSVCVYPPSYIFQINNFHWCYNMGNIFHSKADLLLSLEQMQMPTVTLPSSGEKQYPVVWD